jgi:hypothetical protein
MPHNPYGTGPDEDMYGNPIFNSESGGNGRRVQRRTLASLISEGARLGHTESAMKVWVATGIREGGIKELGRDEYMVDFVLVRPMGTR